MLAALAALERGDACISTADGAARICLAGNVRSMSGAPLSGSWFVLSDKEAPDTWADTRCSDEGYSYSVEQEAIDQETGEYFSSLNEVFYKPEYPCELRRSVSSFGAATAVRAQTSRGLARAAKSINITVVRSTTA